ncbi:MAG: hypothetical protein PUA51_01180 [Oscillospiraceae bacterium]|nr:hypothetical protein [Oscillospiraceae bacterium]
MKFIIPVAMVALVMYFVNKIQNFNKSGKDEIKKMPVSKQILYTLLCFSPYLIFFVIIMIIAMTFR